MARTPGVLNRRYPEYGIDQAVQVPVAIENGASGMSVNRATLAELLGRSPAASGFRKLVLASRAYGLTSGGVHSARFELTDLGRAAASSNEEERVEAKRQAILRIQPFQAFLTAYDGKKVPSSAAFRDFLVENTPVPSEWADDCMGRVLADAETVGFLERRPSGPHVRLEGALDGAPPVTGLGETVSEKRHSPKKVFIAHGTNHAPLDQLKRLLDQISVEYAVAEDQAHVGRPISEKVATMMRRECSSAIFIFTADDHLSSEGVGSRTELWRPRENVIFELGVATALYGRRIVICKEREVRLPSDFADLGYIEFERDQLEAKAADLLRELVGLDIIEVRTKG